MLPVELELFFKVFNGIDVKDDKNLSKYAKWVTSLL